jgi:hypothetical protein
MWFESAAKCVGFITNKDWDEMVSFVFPHLPGEGC